MSRAALLQPNQTAATTIRKCTLDTLPENSAHSAGSANCLVDQPEVDDAHQDGEQRRLAEQNHRLHRVAQLEQQVAPRQRDELADAEIAPAPSALAGWAVTTRPARASMNSVRNGDRR